MHHTHTHTHTHVLCVTQLTVPVTHSHTARDLARTCAGLWMKLSPSTGTGLNSSEDRMAPTQKHSSLAPRHRARNTLKFFFILSNVSSSITYYQKKSINKRFFSKSALTDCPRKKHVLRKFSLFFN